MIITIQTVESENEAGSSDITYFIWEPPFLQGEDYPSLVQAWDNEDDCIFDAPGANP